AHSVPTRLRRGPPPHPYATLFRSLVVVGKRNTGKTATANAGRLLAVTELAGDGTVRYPPYPTAKMSEDTVTDIEAKIDFEADMRSEEHTSELQSREKIVCRLTLEK